MISKFVFSSLTNAPNFLKYLPLAIVLALVSCSGKILKVNQENERALIQIDEYDRAMQVKELKQSEEVTKAFEALSPKKSTPSAKGSKAITPSKGVSKRGKKETKESAKEPLKEIKPCDRKEPLIEDAEGFICRRPKVDPFRIGESTTIRLTYFGIKAGEMHLDVKPFVEVNGKKSYHFAFGAKSNDSFSSFYSVQDSGETFVDYETLLPHNYALHVKESKQLREVRSYIDWPKNLVKFWIRKVTSENIVEKFEKSWDVLPYTQNSFSAIFYMRNFQLKPGKVIQYHIHDEEKNMLMKAEVLRTEKLETELGEMDTVVIRPEIEIGGVFKPQGEILFWLTNDDRKFLVQFSSKIKIGTVMGYVTGIKKGLVPGATPNGIPTDGTSTTTGSTTTTTVP
ncbi:MAG: DUF3108 domain-containing protein [Bdellovibrionales bacterium]|nr:DUF3108 domain-containing protein [Bdellovibrionales bacterium]